MFIYEIRNKTENRIYIGSSIDAEVRWKKHLYMLRKCDHHSSKLQYVFNKYGEDDLTHTILSEHESITRDELYDIEKKLIKKLKCHHDGYNMLAGNYYNKIPSKLMKVCFKKEKSILVFLDKMKELNNNFRGKVFDFYGEIALRTLHLKEDSTLPRYFKLPCILQSIFEDIHTIPENMKDKPHKINYITYLRGGSAQVVSVPLNKKGKPRNRKVYEGRLSTDYYSYVLSTLLEEMEYSKYGKYLITRMREEGIIQDDDTVRDWYNS